MNNDAARLLNDAVINRLADIYLSFLNIPTCRQSYRRIKNAVILCALVYDDMSLVYAELEKTEICSAAEIARDIATTINSLPNPIGETFNNAYCAESEMGFMPKHKNTEDIIAFLGKTFLYILETNYR
ncbi:MAG: hypothetical protein K2M47_05530 [Clostridiales bacterium]|nr:hypothetical protein [Clostridiales bacterium]